MDVSIRPAEPSASDADAINAIYNWYVEHTAISFDLTPVTRAFRLEWLAEHKDGPHRAFVAVDDGTIVGFASSSRYRTRPAYDPSVETSVYVDHDRLGRGIGGRLYARMLTALEREDVHRAYAGIALPNPASIALHERFGFREAGRFTEQGRKFGRYWDVAWFERAMSGAQPAAAPERAYSRRGDATDRPRRRADHGHA